MLVGVGVAVAVGVAVLVGVLVGVGVFVGWGVDVSVNVGVSVVEVWRTSEVRLARPVADAPASFGVGGDGSGVGVTTRIEIVTEPP